MTVPVLAAVTGTTWEATLVAALERTRTDISVVRRCVDLADLLSAAAAGTARAVLLSADLRRLDRDALARLGAARVAVVGLVTPGDEPAEQRLRQLGLVHVLPADVAPSELSAAVTSAVAQLWEDSTSYAEPLTAFPGGAAEGDDASLAADDVSVGTLVAVWGPAGAPGRTTVAVGVATELAAAGVPTVLADADVYGGVVHQLLGFLDEAPGLAAAARLANHGQLDLRKLAEIAPFAFPDLRVLTGISRAARWPELRPSALAHVWSLCRRLAAVTVVDCGFALEQDEELSFDTAAPRRNGATLLTVEEADIVLVVGSADPVGLQRLVRGLSELHDMAPDVVPRVILNKVRDTAVGADPRRQLRAALERFAGVSDISFVPYDREAMDRAALRGSALCEVARSSPARVALVDVAAAVTGRAPPPRRRRFLARLR